MKDGNGLDTSIHRNRVGQMKQQTRQTMINLVGRTFEPGQEATSGGARAEKQHNNKLIGFGFLPDSREITVYLKGFAIASVLINHYVNAYLSDNLLGYANGIISLFFVSSGYGAAHSLKKYDKINLPAVLDYYARRALRIYPLFWVSLLLYSVGRHKWPLLTTVVAFPFAQAPNIYQ